MPPRLVPRDATAPARAQTAQAQLQRNEASPQAVLSISTIFFHFYIFLSKTPSGRREEKLSVYS